MFSPTHIQRYAELAAAGRPFVAVTMVDAHGSTPQDAGSKMIVTPDAPGSLDHGTVGGGKIEAKAIDEALALMKSGGRTKFVDWSLKADVGMTCGGRVRLYFESVNVNVWPIVIFGAGHVTQALAKLLAGLPCTVTCIDPRAEWLSRLPDGVATVRTDDPPAEVERLPVGAFVLCMTQGHRSDFPVLQAIFAAGRKFPFLGVIGSDAKAAVLRRELKDAGIAADAIDFECPVGLPIGSNHPAEIAVSIAAQLLQVRDEHASAQAR
ncbi:MAG: xanthine dehydrogenase accessory protein XdhC [Planctomycetota bacterium]